MPDEEKNAEKCEVEDEFGMVKGAGKQCPHKDYEPTNEEPKKEKEED